LSITSIRGTSSPRAGGADDHRDAETAPHSRHLSRSILVMRHLCRYFRRAAVPRSGTARAPNALSLNGFPDPPPGGDAVAFLLLLPVVESVSGGAV
jgi:hypothetical protein